MAALPGNRYQHTLVPDKVWRLRVALGGIPTMRARSFGTEVPQDDAGVGEFVQAVARNNAFNFALNQDTQEGSCSKDCFNPCTC